MLRFVGPFVLLAGAAGVSWYNATHQGSMVMIAFIDLLPGVGDDLASQGRASWMLLLGVGLLWLTAEVLAMVRRWREPLESDED